MLKYTCLFTVMMAQNRQGKETTDSVIAIVEIGNDVSSGDKIIIRANDSGLMSAAKLSSPACEPLSINLQEEEGLNESGGKTEEYNSDSLCLKLFSYSYDGRAGLRRVSAKLCSHRAIGHSVRCRGAT